jgi:hypothetical protein
LLIACIGPSFAALLAQQNADAACMVTTSGVVDCNADTITTNSTNLNGTNPVSSDQQQIFDNGAAISAAVQSGVTVGGFGLELTENAAARVPILMSNQGQMTTANAVNALQLNGNGGPIRYFGDGSISNSDGAAALFVDNVGGNVSITTGSGAISGPIGINASTTGAGAIRIATGSGLVSGTAGEGILASTASGAIRVAVGSGGVTSALGDNPAINLTSTNGDIKVTADGNVSADSVLPNTPRNNFVHGIEAASNGLGDIVINGSGTIFGQLGRGIYALESGPALGGILITGSGDTISGTASLGCCSAIRAEIRNPADSSNIIVNRSGDITAISTITPPEEAVSAAIHAITAGTGNMIVATGANATISNSGLFGIDATAFGKASSGGISVLTGLAGTVEANGTGVIAENEAFAIPEAAHSTITVTANGTINSGAQPNPVGFTLTGGSGATSVPAGIIAGYDGGPVFGPASGPYTSCGFFGCTTLTPNQNVNGLVSVVNNAVINAAGGDGIFAFNFGNGDVSVTSTAPITVTGATSQNGIEVFSAEVGNISVVTGANITTSNGNGIQTTSAGVGTTTINVLGGTIQGGTSGITSASAGGPIQIDNSATIQNISGLPGDLAVATSGGGNATLINNTRAVVTGTVSMAGTGTNSFANAGIWNTLGTSTFAGSSSINNSGTINVFGATTFSGLTTLTNSGILSLAVGSGAVSRLTITGNLAFQSGAAYLVQIRPSAASLTNVSGTASLAGTVEAAFASGAYTGKIRYDILHSGGLGGSTFGSLVTANLPAGLDATLSYSATDVFLSLAAVLGSGGGLNANQQNVATSLNNFFNNGGTLTPAFMSVFGLSGGSLATALSQLSGEVGTDAERSAFQLTNEFLGLMLDPFVDGRLGGFGNATVVGSQAVDFAPEQAERLPPEIALAYGSILNKAPPKPTFEQRWTAWGAAYGGGHGASGDSATARTMSRRRRSALPAVWIITCHPTRCSALRSAAAAPAGVWRTRSAVAGATRCKPAHTRSATGGRLISAARWRSPTIGSPPIDPPWAIS